MTRSFTQKWPAIFSLICAFVPQQAFAAASQWELTDGARLRVIAEPAQPGQTELRGMLQIDLEAGWKTYWRDPGSAGIPPQVSVANDAVTGVTIHFPAPEWNDDPYGSWAGYTHPVALPLTFTLSGDTAPASLEADVFLGICRDVCVPVSAQFQIALDENRSNAMQVLLLDAAFAALPGGNSDRLSVETAQWSADGALTVTLRHAGSGPQEPQLFISAGANNPFRKPMRVTGDATTTVFRVEPAFDPAEAGKLDLVVTARNGIDAVETALTVRAP